MTTLLDGTVCAVTGGGGRQHRPCEETVTVRRLVETICRAGGRSPELIADTTKPEGRFVKSNDPARLFHALPDFAPSVDLEAGIARMIGWYEREFA